MRLCGTCGDEIRSPGWRCASCGASPATDAFPEKCYGDLARLEPGNFWFRSRNRLICWALGAYFPSAENFLEVGCGTGYVLHGVEIAFPSLALHGSELHISGLRAASQRLSRANLFQMDARRIPFRGEFDAIGCFDVIEHIEEDERALCEIHSALKPGGGFLMTVPQHPSLWGPSDEFGGHVRRYERRALLTKLRQAGFSIVRASSFVSFLLPALATSRLWTRKSGAPYDPTAELKLNALVNAAFGGIMGCEIALIRAGWNFPAGGSLIVIATKS